MYCLVVNFDKLESQSHKFSFHRSQRVYTGHNFGLLFPVGRRRIKLHDCRRMEIIELFFMLFDGNSKTWTKKASDRIF